MKTFTAKYEGWFYFCPVWMDDIGECPLMQAKYRLDLLFDLATEFALFSNWILLALIPNYGAGFVLTVRKLDEPRQIT